ncbi:MAG: hydantoinase/oxoprolinase family protein [Arenicellales bacterium]|jgi:N-methylhydantoinase A|nr:methylhydantoinase [Acidiferrobacteraceae bacterium]MDP6135153.1 hydantoinase/oxoprolinase family protein [Arenicellales bacterium]MDP6393036.1 hydantoinase/oxoprolinase family protein [Arenicellales bacterium]MDP7219411.1 hydantoinase/oxoprolinase family protein [Arenicellales bacterium]HJP10349.1 hydantoinase/oxoprolinase family protein [Arenicellales bacterium]|tara:strand:+ start:56 stop:2131 length:2076 start_codon:yes stop_codon:yes gene_type:complete
MARVGVDVGGTNTDLVLEADHGVYFHKVASTPQDQSEGVIKGLSELCEQAQVKPDEIELIVHGTTVATNITLEHNGAEVGMITTRNFRDILHIGRHKRPHNFSLHFDVPWQSRALVKRRNRIPVTERIMPPTGEVETPLNENEVLEAVALFKKRGIESVVIGFLFSFLNDSHERQARAIVEQEMPGVFVCTSSDVANVLREYERFSTAAMNAFVGPSTSFYLSNLQGKLSSEGFRANLRVMQSNGSISTIEASSRRAVNMLMSGPAGGVIGGKSEGLWSGSENMITVDIGGTSADISTIPGGQIKIMNARDSYISGHPILVPMIDLVTIGAGGGSIAYVDSAGGFHVGPRSAGADPGPACYGLGGEEPTVTDAQVVLGRLDADKMLGGDLLLDEELARRAVENKIARPLGVSVTDAALGVIKVINSNMALAIRSNSVARGVDPREFSLMPFGGAGPLHGVALAEAVSAKNVIVPVAPGITAAMGLLQTDMQYEHARSLIRSLSEVSADTIERMNTLVSDLVAECRKDLENDGVPVARQQFQRIAECRYHGQGFELRADIPEGEVTQANMPNIVTGFHAQHRLDYGYAFEDGEVELITIRVIGMERVTPLKVSSLDEAGGSTVEDALLYHRETVFDDGRAVQTPRYDRDRLRAGHTLTGPSIVIQHNSTILIPPGYVAHTGVFGNLTIERSN